ncbi:MAG: pyridoxal-phosphate dependent enzyme, partial [Actinobacteria bacterium]|nr:pyridoxal-phosphate dependent enzyme [Actinomycetota bacterium]
MELSDVHGAADRIDGIVRSLPVQGARWLTEQVGGPVYLVPENLQRAGSFKIRGAYNRMAQLSRDELKRGVIASSAGNHAQGVALSAQRLGCRAVIVMPSTTPEVKVRAVRALGGDVVLHGETYDECSAEAQRRCK